MIQDAGSDGGTAGKLKITDGTETLSGANTYTGTTTINGTATLAIGSGGSIAFSSGVVDAGTFDISASGGASIKSLSSNGTVTLGGNTLILTAAADTFYGHIDGSGGLTVGTGGGGGTETLSGPNTYIGATTIDTGAELIIGRQCEFDFEFQWC